MAYKPQTYRPYVAGAVTAALVGFSFTPVVQAASFSDINEHSHKSAILSLVDQGIIKGYPDGTFKPYDSITRGDAAVMVARTFGLLDGKNIPSTNFTDLHNVNSTTQEAIAKLAEKGIISGFTTESFRPLESITRAQMAKYIVNAFALPVTDALTPFPDVDENGALSTYVAAVAKAGITIGKSDGSFGYGDQLNRGDFAAMIYRAQNIDIEPVNPLTIEGDNQGNNLINGSAKTYTVTLTNPVSGKPIQEVAINITFEENLHTNSLPQNNVWVTNGEGDSTIPYQSDDGKEAVIKIYTDRNGKATFTVTGSNATVTPIVFLDGSKQLWDTNGGIEIETQDGRFNEIEYHAKAEPVTFSVIPYHITVEGQRTHYSAIAQKDENGNIIEHNGREYKVKVTKPDGTPYGGGIVNIGVEELLDRKGDNDYTRAYFVNFKNATGQYLSQGQMKLNSKGEANFILASTDVNDSAKPIVWIDQNYANNEQPGTLQSGEPMSDSTKVEWTNFQPIRVDDGMLGAKLVVTQENSVGEKNFTLTFLNQSGKVFNPGKEVKAHVTFQVINTGTHRVEINTSLFNNLSLTNVQDAEKEEEKVVIEVGGRVTISGDTPISIVNLSVNAIEGISSVQVKGSAVLFHDVGYESNSVYVYTDYVEASLPYSYTANILSTLTTDTNGNGANDQIVLTFDKEVYHFEPGDFRITHSGGNFSANKITKENEKLILSFSEEALKNGEATLKYDPNYSGTEVLTDEFGNKVQPFQILLINEDLLEEENQEEIVDGEVAEENVEVIEKPEEAKPIEENDGTTTETVVDEM